MIFTIGYEGAQLPDFLATLENADVKLLVDVREVSVSRRKGFAKTALSQAVAGVGMEYVHLRGLGAPKPGREAARQGTYKLFKTIYENHLCTAPAIQGYEY